MMRERLVELIKQGDKAFADKYTGKVMLISHIDEVHEFIADYLIANGVVVMPCKVGDVVYAIFLNIETNVIAIHRGYIGSIDIRSAGNHMFICHDGLDDEPYYKNICCKFEDFGKTVFLNREDAERALKGEKE